MNNLENLEEQLKRCLQKVGRLSLKYLNKQLTEYGDIVVKIVEPKNDLANFDAQSFVKESQEWVLPVKSVRVTDSSVAFFLKRETAFRCFITECLEGKFGRRDNAQQIILSTDVDKESLDNMNITEFRILTVNNVVRNLFEFGGFNFSNDRSLKENTLTIKITRNRSKATTNEIDLICGPVTTNGINATDFIKKRANDMQLIAQHKYGIRVRDHQRFQEMIASLGRSAAIVDMLESKASSPIDMKTEKNQSSKGAAFILYNYARISVLFKTLSEKQRTRYYPDLPSVENVDFTLLKEEDEWHLFWAYVVGFPDMIKQALGDGQLSRMSPHLVLSFASGLVICLSKYYRRVRILTENREHLLPTMYARIYLLKSVFHVLSALLKILDLEAVTQM
ncbi:DALR anticodon-binding domain-containing protein 3 [Ochlerotatus camptorhynchus]|uniref:DALR anticodon-binding domain-containing protein 3 n=1 Tax=Ochlerotatus camptorhynchus TaxID=644619 RepID=UPI0031D6C211